MKRFRGAVLTLAAIPFILLFIFNVTQYSRTPPGNLTVFVRADDFPPREFYSSPHANQLIEAGFPIARIPLLRALKMGIPIAEQSRQDFDCWHNFAAWQLIDRGLWPNYCRWNSEGEWQNSQWPYLIEAPLRMFGLF